MGGLSVAFSLLFWGPAFLPTLASTLYNTFANPVLMAIPLFILMGNFLRYSGIGEELYKAMHAWLGRLNGGLAMGTVVICAIFAAMTGVSGAGTIAMGVIALPAMLQHRYDKKLAIGTVAAGGLLGILIPPSVIMILYASLASLSVGQLFMAGFIPGIILALLYILYIGIRCYFQPYLGPGLDEKVALAEKIKLVRTIVLPGIIVVLVLGGIYSGATTPTEASGVGSVAILVAIAINRRLKLEVIRDSVYSSLRLSAMVFWLIAAATTFSHFIAVAGAQQLVTKYLTGLTVSPFFIVLAMQLSLLILGMLMDDFAIILLCTPIYVPIITALGVDPLWFGVLFVINMNIAWLTPPYGFNLFYMKGIVAEDTTMGQIYRSVIPFIGCQMICLVLVMIFPQTALFIPSLMIAR
jgi:tripartite ATP-independent transporter DctM subunit